MRLRREGENEEGGGRVRSISDPHVRTSLRVSSGLYTPKMHNRPPSMVPPSIFPVLGVPPWNNAGCKFTDMEDQLDLVNPQPKAGGKDVWHPPSRQVSDHF